VVLKNNKTEVKTYREIIICGSQFFVSAESMKINVKDLSFILRYVHLYLFLDF